MSESRVAFDEESLSRSPHVDVLLLIVFTMLLSLWGLSDGPWLSDHEAIIAQGARQIRQGDGWIIPKVGDSPFIRKPPLPFWLTAITSKIVDPPNVETPVSPRAARLPSAVAAILATMLIYSLGRSMYGHRIGVLCGIVMGTCTGTLFFAHEAQVEMVLTLLCAATFACFWRATQTERRRGWWLAGFYACFAFAMLAKAPFPLAVIGLPLACWWFLTIPLLRLNETPCAEHQHERRWVLIRRQIVGAKRLVSVPGVLLFLLIFLPWPIYVYFNVDNALDLWRLEFLARYTGDLYGKNHSFLYYLPLALAWIAPFSLSLPEALAAPFLQAYREHRKPLLFAFTWVAVTTGFLGSSAFKVPRYLVVCIPGFALLLGPVLDRLFFAVRTFSIRGLRLTKTVLLVGIPVAAMVGAVIFVDRYPEQWAIYRVAGVIVILGGIVSTLLFAPGRRITSLLFLEATVALAFTSAWDAIGLSDAKSVRTRQIVEQFHARFIGDDDRVVWVCGRSDARLAYYTGLRIRPLFEDSELGPLREGRKTLPPELLTEGVRRITERLSSDTEEYFIADARLVDRMREAVSTPIREVFRVSGSTRSDDDDLVVLTNQWNTGEWEKIYPSQNEREAKLPIPLEPLWGPRVSRR